jgi:mercuric ion transport protein
MTKTICYWYNYSDEEIREDVRLNNGRSTILEHIAEEKKKRACQCKTKHPEGRWCLSDVHREVDKAIKELQENGNNNWVNADLPQMQIFRKVNNANRRLPIFSRVQQLPWNTKTKPWRLLCFLLFWWCTLPTDSEREGIVMSSKKALLSIGLTGSIVTALCCFTPILVVLLSAVGLSALVGYLDYVLLPALAIFVGILLYALLCK